jgi:hypothetical protein
MRYASGSERENQLAEGKLRVVLQEHRFHPAGRKAGGFDLAKSEIRVNR